MAHGNTMYYHIVHGSSVNNETKFENSCLMIRMNQNILIYFPTNKIIKKKT